MLQSYAGGIIRCEIERTRSGVHILLRIRDGSTDSLFRSNARF